MNDDYRKGYRDGWEDRDVVSRPIVTDSTSPWFVPETLPSVPFRPNYTGCIVCGVNRAQADSYCCPHPKCPNTITTMEARHD